MSTNETLHIIFDGPPSYPAPRFVEVENSSGASISAGIWRDRGKGEWELVIQRPTPVPIEEVAMLCPHGYAICAPCNHVPDSWKVQP